MCVFLFVCLFVFFVCFFVFFFLFVFFLFKGSEITRTGTITKTCLFKYTENFTTKKNENFQLKISDIFHISDQNIDCGYSLEPPR